MNDEELGKGFIQKNKSWAPPEVELEVETKERTF